MNQKFRKILFLAALLSAVFLLLLSGCGAPDGQVLPGGKEPLPGEKKDPAPFPVEIVSKGKDPTKEELQKLNTPEELQKVWEQLLFRASYAIQDGFSSYDELTLYQVLELALNVATDAGLRATEDLADGRGQYLSEGVALEYAEKIFGVEKLPRDAALESSAETGPDGEKYYTSYPLRFFYSEIPAYDAKNPFALAGIRYAGEGIYEAEIQLWYGRQQTTLVKKQIYQMARREDGSFYLLSGSAAWEKFGALRTKGDYRRIPFEAVKGYYEYGLKGLDLPGGGILFFREKGDSIALEIMDLSAGEMKQKAAVRLETGERLIEPVVKGEDIFLKTSKNVYVFSKDLTKKAQRSVPANILERREYYDVSRDLGRFTYEDAEGLKVLDVQAGEAALIRAHANPGSERENFMDAKSLSYPRFVMDDTRVFARELGYEWVNYFILFDLSTGEEKIFDYTYDYNGACYIFEDKAVLAMREYDGPAEKEDYRFVGLSFSSGEEKERRLEILSDDLYDLHVTPDSAHFFEKEETAEEIIYSLQRVLFDEKEKTSAGLEIFVKKSAPDGFSNPRVLGVADGLAFFAYSFYGEELSGVVTPKS